MLIPLSTACRKKNRFWVLYSVHMYSGPPAPPPPRTRWAPPPALVGCSSHYGSRSETVFFSSEISRASHQVFPSRTDSRAPGKSKTEFIVDRINRWFIPSVPSPQVATQYYSEPVAPRILLRPINIFNRKCNIKAYFGSNRGVSHETDIKSNVGKNLKGWLSIFIP